MDKKAVVLDFDGVICDSVGECLLSSYNAYQELASSGRKISSLDGLDGSIKQEFYRLRPYARGGEDFLVIISALGKSAGIESQEDFDRLRRSHLHLLPSYKQALNNERILMMEKDRRLWLSLNPLFGIKDMLKMKPIEGNVYILTTKGKSYAVEILRHNGIGFSEDNIITTKQGEKMDNLLKILRDSGFRGEDCCYFEDQVDFLIKAKKHGVNCFLVDWGYVSKDQKEKAAGSGIRIISEGEFREIFRKACSMKA